ncbi:MAG: hypothetical protein AB1324_05600 [Candidatus Micrarchaeota archaeon]
MGKVLEFRGGGAEARKIDEGQPGSDVRKLRVLVESRRGMLAFRAIRQKIRDEALSLSYFFHGKGLDNRPEDFELRIARVSFAMYLLNATDRMLQSAERTQNAGLAQSLDSATKALLAFLDEPYFSADAETIMRSYHSRCEPVLRSVASKCGVQLLGPEPAVEAFKHELADMIDKINGVC